MKKTYWNSNCLFKTTCNDLYWYKLFAAGGEFYKRNDQLFFNSPNDQAPKISLIITDEYGAWTQKNLS
jgi:hypothetical protein